MSDTLEKGALIVAEQIRKNVLQLDIKHEKSAPLSIVSISLGVATSVSDMSMSCQELVKQADTALFRAKDNGRNRVVVFNDAKDMRKKTDQRGFYRLQTDTAGARTGNTAGIFKDCRKHLKQVNGKNETQSRTVNRFSVSWF